VELSVLEEPLDSGVSALPDSVAEFSIGLIGSEISEPESEFAAKLSDVEEDFPDCVSSEGAPYESLA
jgi:hypothetical protein